MSSTATLHPAALLAISKIEADRDAVGSGTYEGRVTVEIDYNLKVGADYEQAINAGVDWRGLFALMASKQNAQTIEAIVREFIETGESPRTEEITNAAKKAVEAAIGKSKRPCRGKVTGTVSILKVIESKMMVAA